MIDHTARRPSQERSLQRFNAILRATEELLQSANIEDISFYDIARQAEVSPASVHYLFPTMATVRIELSKTYNRLASDHALAVQPNLVAMPNPTWQDWLRLVSEATRQYFNANRHICEVLLGPTLHREARYANFDANDRVGRAMLEQLRAVFLVPEVPGLETAFVLNCEIVDGLWSRDYLKYGRIGDEAAEATVRIQIANLRSLLPETLTLIPKDNSAIS